MKKLNKNYRAQEPKLLLKSYDSVFAIKWNFSVSKKCQLNFFKC